MTEPTATITDRVGDWAGVLSRKYTIELAELKRLWPHQHSFVIDTDRLAHSGALGLTLLTELERSPDRSISDIRDALIQRCQYEVSSGRIDPALIEVRPANHNYTTPIGRIRSGHANTLVSLDGIIRRATQPIAHMTRAVYRCRSCGALTDPIPQGRRQAEEPDICPRCERKARMDLIKERSSFIDYQRLQLAENPEGASSQPQAIDVDVVGDVVGAVQPGDRVRITGILRTQQERAGVQNLPDFKYYLECLSIRTEELSFEEVRIDEADERKIRELAAQPNVCHVVGRSISPSVYGHERVKRAIGLQLFGGVRKTMADGTPRRGDVHVLLVGDPGIAKSVLLRYAVKVAPRGIYTSGQGTTKAGLTAAAVKDDFSDGRWMLEAGALVLADTGMAAVDELDKMSDTDRSGLHEAMEQQSVSLAKAGITATLRSRCALLGAANPKKGRFDMFVPLAEQINMPPSLLSRFDLIFVLQDVADPEADARLSRHLLGNHRQQAADANEDVIPPELLRKWVKMGRDLNPVLTDAAEEAIHAFYLGMRSGAQRKGAPLPITPRQEEGVIRLAEGAARMRLSETVSADDVRVAMTLMDSCLRDVAYDAETGQFDIDRLYSGASQKDRGLEREIEAMIQDAEGKMRVSAIFESFMGRGHGLDQIERNLARMERSGYSIANGMVYRNEN
ncbi:minichromosome maintenance protein MCM [Methanoculleus sp. Afa-1]|uniref:DNA helicase n=1 Tax=Methanoculleus formosensis TaxID=2590886 RepID=A0A9E5DD48_9EURY|nr:minichromosome maintenance protein MCM [Methanoculleus sp. Afa-1]MCT8336928.1 minichromosome maintenance protein MCM [Methanoculleus sp. Afa-1]